MKNIKRKSRKVFLSIAATLALSTSITPSMSVFASTEEIPKQNQTYTYEKKLVFSAETISRKDEIYLEKIASVAEYFYFDSYERSQISLTKTELIDQYNFSSEEVDKLFSTLSQQLVSIVPQEEDHMPMPALHVSGGRVYISNLDLDSTAFAAVAAASTAGPAAIQAAFLAAASIVGGPIGTAIGAVMAVVGGPGLIDIAGHVATALITNEGIYIGTQWRYPFVDVGYWSGR